MGSLYGLYIGLAVDHAAAMNCINVLLVAGGQTVCMPAAMLASTDTAVVDMRYGCWVGRESVGAGEVLRRWS